MKQGVFGKVLCACLALGLVAPGPLPAQNPSDAEVAKGIKQVEDGDLDAAIFTLDAAARRLSADPSRTRESAQAYLYLGVAYLGKGHEMAARAKFREAVQQLPDLSLSPDQFPPRVIDIFEAAKAEVTASAARAKPAGTAPSPSPAPPPSATTAKKGASKTPLILAGIAIVGGVGVLAARGGSGASTPSASSTSANYRVDAAATQPLPAHGGSGGGRFQMECPPGSLMHGIAGRSDIFVTRLAARCAVLQPDGSLGAETLLAFVGGSNGSDFDDHCPGDQVVVFLGRSEALAPIGVVGIQSLGIGCATVREWVASGTRGQVFAPHGGSGGPAFSDQCPQGYVVTSFTGATGGIIIDVLAATCTRILR